jgi:glycosyltransferase involved in cell wall biosynthesis
LRQADSGKGLALPPRRISYVITNADLGGAQRHLLTLVESAVRNGFSVDVFVGEAGPTCNLLRALGVQVYRLSGLKRRFALLSDANAITTLRRQLSKRRPDLLHLHSSKAGLIGRLAALGMNVPIIYTAHGWGFKSGVPVLRRAIVFLSELLTSRLAAKIICVSRYDFELACRLLTFARERVVLIRNGVPDTGVRASPASTPTRVVMVARFQEPKLQTVLIAAVKNLPISVELFLVGDGPMRAKAEKFALSQGLAKRVRFMGEVTDVPNILKSCHIFVMISAYEGLPLSILEAMSVGLPCVASNVGGVSEAIEDGLTGLLIQENTATSVAEALLRLINDPVARAAMGQAARKRYEERFTTTSMTSATLGLYKQLILKGIR